MLHRLPVPSYTSICFDQFLITTPSGTRWDLSHFEVLLLLATGGVGAYNLPPHWASNDVILAFSDIYFEVVQDETWAISKCYTLSLIIWFCSFHNKNYVALFPEFCFLPLCWWSSDAILLVEQCRSCIRNCPQPLRPFEEKRPTDFKQKWST